VEKAGEIIEHWVVCHVSYVWFSYWK